MSKSYILLGAALLAASAPATAQTSKQLVRLQQQIEQASQSNPSAVPALKARYAALTAQSQSQVAAATATVTGGPQFVVAANYNLTLPCGGSSSGTAGTTVTVNSTPNLAILDNTIVADTVAVSGLGTQIFDVDVTLAITHTWNSDLEIKLISPAGTNVLLSDNRGGANDDVFNGTLFDDQSANPISTYVFTNLVTAPDLRPDQSLNDTLRGENPNGNWTLQIADQAGGDVGVLSTWSLAVTDGAVSYVAPSYTNTTFSSGPISVPITDFTISTAPLTISGGSTSINGVAAYVEIVHTWNSDLQISLQSPIGTTVMLSNRRGGANDDVFNGTTFEQTAPIAVGAYPFVNGVAAPLVRPDGDLNAFVGENANGTWNLVVSDLAGGDIGSINRFDLIFKECANTVLTYCTAGTTTNGCAAAISATGNPSVSLANPCQIDVTNVEGNKSGLIFYSISGQSAVAWNASSFLCVKAPTQRTPTQTSTGTTGLCDGTMTLDWNAYQVANPGAVGNPWSAGNKAQVQAWFRDPPAGKSTNLSNAIELTYVP